MTVEIRPYDSLGKVRMGWLNASHHFSFGHYHDPARMGVGPLRVWNDDEIEPRTGFDPHPHCDMEIITYVRRGRHHPPGQPRQRGADRGGRRAGDVGRHGCPSRGVQPRG
jgi:redox-sensitive bicupin YhaK (pirin superfamily)